jgi:hypothetical protein
MKDKAQRNAYLKNVYTTMVIAMYNLGVEHEHMHEFGQAIDYFNRASSLNNEQLGKEISHMTKVIADGLLSVQQKHHKKMVIVNAYAQGMNSNIA